MKRAICIIAMVALAAGCESFSKGFFAGTGEKEEKVVGKGGQKGPVEVIVHYADGQPARQMVQVKGTATVLEVTRAVAQVETEQTPSGEQRVIAIGGDRNGLRAGRMWVYELNNLPQLGAPNTRYVQPGDTVRWRYR